ncbi:MAG TPA: Lrp/AsnC family transcriptional regulator [Methanothrix sp.]|jgi:DNA-binding Lrp family transcriptional regulator|nr:Lrp/AsnC family transcriptional regulator [Methanothrix sp.]HOV82497.1 Lrp/AsnC family transcriptional regulator [Methanothrix sp.]HPC90079.1 Lrp/AsnC family transcriptional regulator [Methanothrix sp.]HQE87941.1 Lrp/AsnC family transcriptional regulator [Methanothrix sp.]HQI68475.1 Lrp/AsnC family transcriptional regulator [Methanothrix sp.]
MSAEEALEYIKSRPEGALQSDLWKALKIDSRKCSRIVAKLLKDNLITREVESVDGIRTYRLFCAPKPKERRFYPLLALDTFEPCAGCIDECIPEHCAKLSEWIFSIVMSRDDDGAREKTEA